MRKEKVIHIRVTNPVYELIATAAEQDRRNISNWISVVAELAAIARAKESGHQDQGGDERP